MSMTKRRSAISVLVVLFALLVIRPAGAQTYSFNVPSLQMDVAVQPDGSADIVYDITFENYGSPIDVLDIGTPNEDYDVDDITASIDGAPLTDIRPSSYIDVGIEIHLEQYEIDPGETATLHIEFTAPDLVYADTTREDYASLQITPTWFDSELVEGTGDIEIRVATLPGIEPDAVLYQDEPFTDKVVDDQGRVVALWLFEDVSPTEAYRVGVSFPRQGLTQVIEVTFWDLLGRWLSGVLPILTFCVPFAIIAIIFIFIIRGAIRAAKPNYLPPIAEVEGGGIKRGLTAPEAAVILELPLNRIMGLVIFGMLEKGLIRQTDPDPLKVEVVEAFRTQGRPGIDDAASRESYRRQVAQEKGTVIHAYEHPFLDLFEDHPNTVMSKLNVVEPMETLVNGVAAKMAGFDLSDTQDYYRRIVERAIDQAAALGEVETREAYLDKYYPWVMLGPNYRPAMTIGNYHYWPRWARTTTGSTGAGRIGGAARAGGRSTTTFGDVSASFAGWAETSMGAMAAAILPTSLSKPTPTTTRATSGGSGGRSCACACAGCACACACAGGGR